MMRIKLNEIAPVRFRCTVCLISAMKTHGWKFIRACFQAVPLLRAGCRCLSTDG